MKRPPIDAYAAPATRVDSWSLFDDPEPEPKPKVQWSGSRRAWDNADDYWRSVAMQGLKTLAASGKPFDAFDVAELGVPEPDHPNRWGALFRAAATAGVIKAVGYHESKRPGRSGGACRVWQGAGS